MSWLFYAISSIAVISITNLSEKFIVEKRVKNFLFLTILYGLISSVFGLLIYLVHGVQIIHIYDLALVLLSGIFFCWYIFPYFIALEKEDASRVVPFFQFVPLFVLILSSLFLGEMLTGKQLIGFIALFIGGSILAIEKFSLSLLKPRKAVWYMMLSSLLYAISVIIFKGVVNTVDFWTTFVYQSFGIGLGSLLVLFFPPVIKIFFKEIKRTPLDTFGIISVSHLIGFFGELLTQYAISLAPVALVSVVGGIQPVFVLLYGIILSVFFPHIIKEDISRKTLISKLIAISVIFLGIYIIYL